VTAPYGSGRQSQFAIAKPLGPTADKLGRILCAAVEDVGAVYDVGDLVTHSAMSRGSFERLFRDRLGTSPRSWLADRRVQAARRLLEETAMNVDEIAWAVGFGSVQALRRDFRLSMRITPTTYRWSFRAGS
jgi:AraC family transcriptional activator FtrA